MEQWKLNPLAHVAKELQAALQGIHRLRDDLGDQMDCAANHLAEVQLSLAEAQAELDAHSFEAHDEQDREKNSRYIFSPPTGNLDTENTKTISTLFCRWRSAMARP